MIKSLAISALVFAAAFLLTDQYVGYPRAGKLYITEQREKRKSIRPGTAFYGFRALHGSGSRGYRGGK